MELFYSGNISNNEILLDEEESHHCMKVMRHHIGDELMVTDGKGKLFRTILEGERKKSCLLKIGELSREESQSSPSVHIAIAPTKNIDRFEWFLEKATEIGITEITPIICIRSERDKIKHERLEKILIGAMKQSLRLWLSKLNPIIKLNEFVNCQSSIDNQKFIAHCQSPNLPSLQSLYRHNADVLIMIGPEGDFTREEIQFAEKSGFSAVNLGENRLRTETAGLVAVHTIRLLNG